MGLPARRSLYRPKGAGTVVKVGPESWRARGAKVSAERRTLGLFDTWEKAEAARACVAEGRDVGTWCRALCEERKAARGRSYATERSLVRVHVEGDALGAMALEDVRPQDVRAWLARLCGKSASSPRTWRRTRQRGRLAARTIGAALALLARSFARAVAVGRVDRNPCDGVRPPRQATKRLDFEGVLSLEEQRAVLAACGPELRALVAVGLGLGLRPSELWGLRWEDVDVAARAVVIRCGKRGEAPKSGHPRRLPLFGVALEGLAPRLEEREAVEDGAKAFHEVMRLDDARGAPDIGAGAQARGEVVGAREQARASGGLGGAGGAGPLEGREGHGASVPRTGLVFPTVRGRMRRKAPTREFRAVLLAAGITRRVDWRDLRHTCATSLLCGWWGRRWSVRDVGALLGHSNVQVTERYLHARNDYLFTAASETQGVLFPT